MTVQYVNGSQTTAVYGSQDRLKQYGNTTYAYTANGELASKTAANQPTTYQYDVLGNLKKVGLPGGKTIEYLIDGENHRVGKKVNGVLVKGYLWESNLCPVAELDGNQKVVSRFVYANDVNVPEYILKGGIT